MPSENDLYQEWLDKIGTKPVPWREAKAILAEVERRRQERAQEVANRLLGRKAASLPDDWDAEEFWRPRGNR